MTERPILFSAGMVRALLAATKTQTRRPMRIQPHDGAEVVCDYFYPTVIDKGGEEQPGAEVFGAWWSDGEEALRCPYGQPGDRLWVREAWRTTSELDKFSGCNIAAKCVEAGYVYPWAPLHYEADGSSMNWMRTGTPPHGESEPARGRYRHARFMPRWASRITLEITQVRVPRLQQISESDAYDEGIDTLSEAYLAAEHASIGGAPGPAPAVCAYASLWDSINGPGSWDVNPYVWAISFKRLTP